jgi:hypothetical protein
VVSSDFDVLGITDDLIQEAVLEIEMPCEAHLGLSRKGLEGVSLPYYP